jgi:hypothetical protein
MRQKTLVLVVLGIVIGLITGLFLLSDNVMRDTPEELKLSDFPAVFTADTVIVIGENASEIEKGSADAIAASLLNLTGNKPKIYISKNIESFKYDYNSVILSTSNSNGLLKEVYDMANVTRVTDEYPGEGKGVVEIVRNP